MFRKIHHGLYCGDLIQWQWQWKCFYLPKLHRTNRFVIQVHDTSQQLSWNDKPSTVNNFEKSGKSNYLSDPRRCLFKSLFRQITTKPPMLYITGLYVHTESIGNQWVLRTKRQKFGKCAMSWRHHEVVVSDFPQSRDKEKLILFLGNVTVISNV